MDAAILLNGFFFTPCDKCEGEVELGNDALALDVIRTGNPALGFAISRHLLPVVVDGQTVCPGSPSRAQYLEGQPRDTRSAHAYNPENELPNREAYQQLLEFANALTS